MDDSLANISSKINIWKRLITWFGGKSIRYDPRGRSVLVLKHGGLTAQII